SVRRRHHDGGKTERQGRADHRRGHGDGTRSLHALRERGRAHRRLRHQREGGQGDGRPRREGGRQGGGRGGRRRRRGRGEAYGRRRGGGGSIILVGSVSALAGFPRAQDAYTAAKGALISLNKSLAIQFAKDGIRSNVIHPGIVETPLKAPYLNDELRAEFKTGIPLGRIGQPRDIAYAALFLASDESSFMTGAEMIVDGGFMAQEHNGGMVVFGRPC